MNQVPTTVPQRLDFDDLAPGYAKALAHLDNAAVKELDRAGIDAGLRELLRLRVSQVNGCAYCVDMHTKDARSAGESEDRLTGLPVWRETPFFSERERAALAFAEQVALMSQHHVPQDAYDAVAAAWSAEEISALVALVVTVNAWNGVGVSTHTWEPGSYA